MENGDVKWLHIITHIINYYEFHPIKKFCHPAALTAGPKPFVKKER